LFSEIDKNMEKDSYLCLAILADWAHVCPTLTSKVASSEALLIQISEQPIYIFMIKITCWISTFNKAAYLLTYNKKYAAGIITPNFMANFCGKKFL
jgi:hypothetical protein